jgi:YNFM family putative membrane transporter
MTHQSVVKNSGSAFHIRPGTTAYRRASAGLLLAGLCTFNTLYCVQPLMPLYSSSFHVNADSTALLLSLAMSCLAISLFLAAPLADRWGRKPVMLTSMFLAGILTFLVSVLHDWTSVLICRALSGFALGGLPAVAMTYIAEEIEPAAMSGMMGFYIGGNALGGVMGRLLNAFLADFYSWRFALQVSGLTAVAGALLALWLLPRSRVFVPRRTAHSSARRIYGGHLADPAILLLLAQGGLLAGAFVVTLNILTYRLVAAPFSLSIGITSLVFVVYLLGTPATILAGRALPRTGGFRMLGLGVGLMLAGTSVMSISNLPAIALGLALITIVFFVGHSTASWWVGVRSAQGRAQAASLCLFCFYAGAGVVSWVGGHAWTWWQWTGITLLLSALLLFAMACAVGLRRASPA